MNIKAGEKGFTLLELLVGLSIAALVTSAASMTIITMMRLSPQSNNWAVALHQVQYAGHWISRDVMMSSGNITVGDKSPEFLTLTLPQITPPDKTVVYKFETLSGQEWLTRTDSTGGTIAIAEYISTDNTTTATYSTNCTDNCTLTFTIVATRGNVTVSRQYEAAQRVPAP